MKLFFCSIISLLFCNCAVVPQSAGADSIARIPGGAALLPSEGGGDSALEWLDVADGIKCASFTDQACGAKCHAAIIDLQNPHIALVASVPKVQNGDAALNATVFKAESVKNFAKRTGALVAINATPFNYPKGRLSSKRTLAGMYVLNGRLVSATAQKYAALLFLRDDDGSLCAKIMDSQNEEELPQNAAYAFGGFWTILRGKAAQSFSSQIRDARSAAGSRNNGKQLVLLSVEGTGGSGSSGASFEQTASIMLRLGAEDAIMLDGGSSSSLVVGGKRLTRPLWFAPPVAASFGFVVNSAGAERVFK